MAVVADIDGLELWVEPHHLTFEEGNELSRFIREHREKHPLSEYEKQELQDWVLRLRFQSEFRDCSIVTGVSEPQRGDIVKPGA